MFPGRVLLLMFNRILFFECYAHNGSLMAQHRLPDSVWFRVFHSQACCTLDLLHFGCCLCGLALMACAMRNVLRGGCSFLKVGCFVLFCFLSVYLCNILLLPILVDFSTFLYSDISHVKPGVLASSSVCSTYTVLKPWAPPRSVSVCWGEFRGFFLYKGTQHIQEGVSVLTFKCLNLSLGLICSVWCFILVFSK